MANFTGFMIALYCRYDTNQPRCNLALRRQFSRCVMHCNYQGPRLSSRWAVKHCQGKNLSIWLCSGIKGRAKDVASWINVCNTVYCADLVESRPAFFSGQAFLCHFISFCLFPYWHGTNFSVFFLCIHFILTELCTWIFCFSLLKLCLIFAVAWTHKEMQ